MEDTNRRMRIILNDTSTKELQAMVKEMRKHRGVSLSPSDLTSWVLGFFSKVHFEKAKPEIVKSFTNFRKLVRDNLKNAGSQEELIHSLKDSLAIAQRNRGAKKSIDGVEIDTNREDIKDK